MANAQIMVVEDTAIVARDIQSRLQSLGYSVPAVVASGEEAIEKADQLLPDLILMDIILKGKLDGVEAAEEIRTRLSIPVVYLTAMSDDHTIKRAKLTEPFGYLVKPFETTDLHTTIEIALHKHEVESNLRQRTQELTALYEVARILAQPISSQDKCKRVLSALTTVAQADLATLRLQDQGQSDLRLATSSGTATWQRPEVLSLDGSVSGAAFKQGNAIAANDYPSHPLAEPTAVVQGIRSVLSLPIRIGGAPVGVVNIASGEADHFTPRLSRLLAALAEGLSSL